MPIKETLHIDSDSVGEMTLRTDYHVTLTEQDLAVLRAMSEDDIFLLAGVAYAKGMRICKNRREP